MKKIPRKRWRKRKVGKGRKPLCQLVGGCWHGEKLRINQKTLCFRLNGYYGYYYISKISLSYRSFKFSLMPIEWTNERTAIWINLKPLDTILPMLDAVYGKR